jgi:Tol biopolymer transport system component
VKSAGRALTGAILMAAVLLSAGCSQIINYPVPSVSKLSPSSASAGGAAFTLTVKGADFVFGGFIIWNGTRVQTLFVNDGELQGTIPPGNISVPGTFPVQVFNPPPGGGYSNSVNFTVKAVTSPVPTITSIQPTAASAAGSGFTVTVTGTNFVPTSVVTWNGNNSPTTFVTNDEIRGTIYNTDVQTPGVANIAVINPPPGGGLSNTVTFPVNNPLPAITTISPVNAISSAPNFTLTVTGGGFTCSVYTTTTTSTTCTTADSVVYWNGKALSTTFVSSTQLTASVTGAQLAQAGTIPVTVVNPTPGGGSSGAANFQVIPGAKGEGLPALVDVSTDGTQADSGVGNLGHAGPAIGGGGRFIAFSSVSQNLVANLANSAANVFVRDTCLGISSGCNPQTVLASVANTGQAPNADALDPSVSSDGRYVVFSSAATNLVSTVTSGSSEIYLRDTCLGVSSGCTPSTSLISLAADGSTPGNGPSTEPFISADGQYVVFVSTATNLVSQSTSGAAEIYVRSTCLNTTASCTPTTTLASVASGGSSPADGTSASPVVSSGGRYVAFQSTATDLVSVPTSNSQQLYWRDTCIGAPSGCTPSTSLVSVASGGGSPGNGPSGAPAISSDGRYVVFSSQATNLIGAGYVSGTPQQIYERDLCAGASGCTPATTLISVATDGSSPANSAASQPETDQSGRYVLFSSKASNLTSAAANSYQQIFARDTCLGASSCTPHTVLISVAADGSTLGNGDSFYPVITTEAHFAAFLSFANGLVTDDTTPTYEDVFLAVTGF